MKPETHRVGEVAFVAEPAGESERMLKTRPRERLRSSPGLIEAYLVSARYEHAPERKLALCRRTDKSMSGLNLVHAGGEEFRNLVDHTQSLDTSWLAPVKYQQVVTVAHPFYRRASTGNA